MVSLRDNKRIVRNTLFLYVRMIGVMLVTLYTSRVVLDKLGVTDFGLYNSVGGIVGMLSFLSSSLSTGTSRFLTYELGIGNVDRLHKTFNTAFYTHLLFALVIVFVLEALGVWFVKNKLIIPPERLSAAIWVFHISVFTTFIAVSQIPYTSVIVAHENMHIYAVIGLIEAFAKLLIVYLLMVSSVDKLIFYAFLVGLVHFLIAISYRLYCIKYYAEVRLSLIFEKRTFRRILSFSGLSLVANLSQMLSIQGMVVLINMFFSPAIVAAQSIGNQLGIAIKQFVNSLQTAINPQIIKLYATGDFLASRNLTLQSSVYIHELVLFLALPAMVVMDSILHFWLVEVPDYAVVFAQYIVLQQIFNVYNGTLYIPMIASGKLGTNSLIAFWFGIGTFVTLYFMLKMGFDVMWIQYIGVLQTIIFSYIIKPYILCKEVNYSWYDIFYSLINTIKVSVIPVLVSILCTLFLTRKSLIDVVFCILVICFSVILSSYIFLNVDLRKRVNSFILYHIRNFISSKNGC